MAIRFISDDEINLELQYLIRDADDYLLLISPYIKLHDKLKRELQTKLNYHQLNICIVFGKNEGGFQKSLSKDDFEFLQQFPNIQIRYAPKLHAKYYASEDRAIFTSMNLHEYSQNNNIEVGIMIDVKKGLAAFGDSILNNYDPEVQANDYFNQVIEQAELKYSKEAEFKKGLLGLSKEYITSKEIINEMSSYYNDLNNKQSEYSLNKTKENNQTKGYCIRTGNPIPFNIKKPYSDAAYKSWQRFANEDYKEKFCHFSGEPCDGETSFKTPILKKHWRTAKATFKF